MKSVSTILQKLLCYIFFTILLLCRIFAWGHEGHQLVAELGLSQLSDATRQKVARILNGMTPAQAGNWMDEVRSDQGYRYTAPWQFTNNEPGESYELALNGDIITPAARGKIQTSCNLTRKLQDVCIEAASYSILNA